MRLASLSIPQCGQALLSLLVLLASGTMTHASAVFDGDAANIWLVNAEDQTVTSFSSASWVDAYAELSGFGTDAPQQVLVNGLPRSSVQMSANQPEISIIGLESADKNSNDGPIPAAMVVSPASGIYNETIEIVFRIDVNVVAGKTLDLRWRFNNGDWFEQEISEASEDGDSGYIFVRAYLVRDNVYDLEVELLDGVSVVDQQTRQFTIDTAAPDAWQRDSDGDGIPDEVELAIGLNPLEADLSLDSDGNGWTDFDEWLRCENGQTDCGAPIDTDGDGWSDFDEQLRGTREDDLIFMEELGFDVDERVQSIRRALQEYPAASRLYEREYIPEGDPQIEGIESLSVATLSGQGIFDLDDLFTDEAIEALGVSPEELADSKRQSMAFKAIEGKAWPTIRIPASEPTFVRTEVKLSSQDNASLDADMLYFSPLGDVMITDFVGDQVGVWNTAEEWRLLLVSWLGAELVKPVTRSFDSSETLPLLALEILLREESRLNLSHLNVQLGRSLPAGANNAWIDALLVELAQREDSLTAWLARITAALDSDGSLSSIADDLVSFRQSLPTEGYGISQWLDDRFQIEVVLADQGCFISAADLSAIQQDEAFFQNYLERCPSFYTDSDLEVWQQAALARRHGLRLTLLAEGLTQVALNNELLLPSEDSDGDSLSNNREILSKPYRLHTLPWASDTDGDGVLDDSDRCPLSARNTCLPGERELSVSVESLTSVSLDGNEGFTLLEIKLNDFADVPVTVSYSIESGPDDSGVAGEDFIAISGTHVFEPGDRSYILSVNLPANDNEGLRQFRLVIADVDGATISGDNFGLVQVDREINSDGLPEVLLASSNLSVNERESIGFDASGSSSGIDDASLSFEWTQISGVSVPLSEVTSPTPTFDAPVVLEQTELVYLVTVTNSDSQQASAQLAISVLPVDDPPELGTPLVFDVAAGETLEIDKASILAAVSEPDGEQVTITSVVSEPEVESFNESLESFTLQIAAGGGVQSEIIAGNSLDVTPWLDSGIAFRTPPGLTDTARTVRIWSPADGLETLVSSDQNFSSIRTSHDPDIVYYSGSGNDSTSDVILYWVAFENGQQVGNGEADTGSFRDLFGAQINPLSGVLYHCDDSWKVLNTAANTYADSGVACNRFSAAGSGVVGDKFCVHSTDGLYCTDDDASLSRLFELNSDESLARIVAGPSDIVVQVNRATETDVYAIDENGNDRLLLAFDRRIDLSGYYWVDNTLYAQVPVENGSGEEGVQVYTWSPQFDQMNAFGPAELFAANVSRFNFDSWVLFDGQLVWMTPKTDSTYGRYGLDLLSGGYSQIGGDINGQRFIEGWGTDPDNLRLIESSTVSEGTCDWFGADTIADFDSEETLEQLLNDVGCFGRIAYGDSLVASTFNQTTFENELSVTTVSVGPSDTQFSVLVEDENGNALEVPISIVITED